MPRSEVITITLESHPELADALMKLKAAYAGFPWCTCEDDVEALMSSSYFTNKHGVSHGYECSTCHGVTQVG